MLEKLYPVQLPPGYSHSGTTFQARDRWYQGNLVRFYQGNIEPVGGWVQRTLTGATILGVPNAAVSWQLNNGATYLAIGTTTNLYVIDTNNVVWDITPTTLTSADQPLLWQLETFGAYLVAAFNRTSYVDTANNNVFVWKGVVTTVAAVPFTLTNGPGSIYGVTVTPERFFVLLRGADPTALPLPVLGTAPTVGGPLPVGAVPDPSPTPASPGPSNPAPSGPSNPTPLDKRAPPEAL